jgi:hypothetical protein
MTALRVLSAAERQREARGTSIVLAGPAGIGKTHQVKFLDPTRTLLIDVDRGALPLINTEVDIVRTDGWQAIADLFALIGGTNPSLSANSAYSQAHFEKVSGLIDVSRYDTFVFDSISQMGRESYRYAEAHPDSPPRSGSKDARAIYGQHARQMIAGLQQAQRGAPNKIIVMTAVLERVTDDLGRVEHRIQLEGDKTARELPSIVDEIIVMNWVTFSGAVAPTRAFICSSPNHWGFPAKDRSGRLDQIEEPNLGKLIRKLLLDPAKPANHRRTDPCLTSTTS